MNITRRDIIRYSVFPGFGPRLKELFLSGFHYIPFFVALVYQSVRLLPASHPYTDARNIGRFGLRHVIAEAANNLIFDKKHIDQIVLFGLILLGLVITFLQFLLLGFSLFSQPVMAQMPTNFSGFFLTQSPSQDLAHIFLDLVFGVPGIFNSCVNPGVGEICQNISGQPILWPNQGSDLDGQWILAGLGWPHPIHNGLHQLFQIYNVGLLVVGALIATYFVFTVVAETAQSGTPFGKRFNKVWAPLRLVMAFGLLVPVGYGLNSAQYIILYAAKFGSGFASNGWTLFNQTLNDETENYVTSGKLISQPNPPEVGGLLQFMYVANVCRHSYMKTAYGKEIKMYVLRSNLDVPNVKVVEIGDRSFNYKALMNWLRGYNNAHIVFGFSDSPNNDAGPQPKDYTYYPGGIVPLCGEITLNFTDARPPPPNPDNQDSQYAESGIATMQAYYWFVIKELWDGIFFVGYDGIEYPRRIAEYYVGQGGTEKVQHPENYKSRIQDLYSRDLRGVMATGRDFLGNPISILDNSMDNRGAMRAMVESGRWALDEAFMAKGWAASALWYNRIAEMNGALTSAFLNIPVPAKYPQILEYVKAKKMQNDKDVLIGKRFEPILSSGKDVQFEKDEDGALANAMWAGFEYWQEGGHTSTSFTQNSQNAFIEAINALFGTEGLYSMRKNADVHPLAQLVGIGRSLVESAVRNIGYATIGGVSGFVASFLDETAAAAGGQISQVLISFFMSIAMISLTAGFILYYIVPFLPFIYFFFAVGGWVKGIFEAMVGAPLWALAHIRIDGEGLPGQAAVNGYFLIFEVFLRPILIVFGLLASISTFAALISVLNEIWDLVTSNLSGFDVKTEIEAQQGDNDFLPSIDYLRNPLDQFFFTVVYALIAYLMAMSSFKMIDLVPNNILRWMGQSVSSFNDQAEDPAQGMVGTATIGAQQTISQIGGGYESALKGVASRGK